MERGPVERSGDQRVAEQRLRLGREQEQPVAVPVVERLLAQPIAGEEEPARGVVPDGEGEHADEPLDACLAVDSVGVQDHLGVASRLKPAARGHELGAQLAIVVDLAVEDDPVAAGGVAHGLAPGHEIDDRQPRHPEPDVAGGVDARVVGAAMLEKAEHRGQELARGRADVAGDAAHQPILTVEPATAAAPSCTSRRSARTRPVVRGGV